MDKNSPVFFMDSDETGSDDLYCFVEDPGCCEERSDNVNVEHYTVDDVVNYVEVKTSTDDEIIVRSVDDFNNECLLMDLNNESLYMAQGLILEKMELSIVKTTMNTEGSSSSVTSDQQQEMETTSTEPSTEPSTKPSTSKTYQPNLLTKPSRLSLTSPSSSSKASSPITTTTTKDGDTKKPVKTKKSKAIITKSGGGGGGVIKKPKMTKNSKEIMKQLKALPSDERLMCFEKFKKMLQIKDVPKFKVNYFLESIRDDFESLTAEQSLICKHSFLRKIKGFKMIEKKVEKME